MRKVSHSSSGVNLGLIITPMLDMAFQVLAFFIMTYHPSALEGHIDGKLLPPSKLATAAKDPLEQKDPLPPMDIAPDLADVILVHVKAVPEGQTDRDHNDGESSQIYVKRPEDATPSLVADTDVSVAEGWTKLEQALKKKPGDAPLANIKLEGDGDLRHQFLMRAYDVCRRAGYQNVNFVAPAVIRKE